MWAHFHLCRIKHKFRQKEVGSRRKFLGVHSCGMSVRHAIVIGRNLFENIRMFRNPSRNPAFTPETTYLPCGVHTSL